MEAHDLEARLRAHVEYLAGEVGERNAYHYGRLEQARLYIEGAFSTSGYQISHDTYEVSRQTYRNVIAELPGADDASPALIVGAHYDTASGTPGADDNASAVAALLEMARLLAGSRPARTLRWAAFTLEEPPFFRTRLMGSRIHARKCRQRGERLAGMISLEMVGYYDDRPGSQQFPLPFMRWFFPERGNFIAVAGNFRSRRLVRDVARRLSGNCEVPVEHVAIPIMPGAGLSDNWSFWREGYPALMITDTAFFRNPHYHMPTDLPDTLDYARLARLVAGLARALSSDVPPTSSSASPIG